MFDNIFLPYGRRVHAKLYQLYDSSAMHLIIIAKHRRENVFVHMQQHATRKSVRRRRKKRQLIFRVSCMCTVNTFITSGMDQSIAEVSMQEY